MKVFFHEDFHHVYTADPAASEGRMQAILNVIEPHVTLVQARAATTTEIGAVHPDAHIEWVRRQGVHHHACLAAGAAIQAAELGMTEPCLALVRPPGHHASPNSAWGFCYFSNMAIAMTHLLRSGAIHKGHVLDFDMHYGDGTVNALERTPQITVHNPEASERSRYLEEVQERLQHCEADAIGISAGFDNHQEDWGGVMDTDDYREMGRMVREAAAARGAGCFAILEGGYNHEVLGNNALALIQGLGEP